MRRLTPPALLALSPSQVPVVIDVCRKALRAGYVEYDPTTLPPLIEALEIAGPIPFTISGQTFWALNEVLKWARSARQRSLWSDEDRKLIATVKL